jgi:hypothetical protein
MRKLKETTTTHLVFEALKRADDFRTSRQLQLETGRSSNRVGAALHLLERYRAVDFVEGEGTLWWFATPGSDTRVRTVEEKAPETRPRRARRKKV